MLGRRNPAQPHGRPVQERLLRSEVPDLVRRLGDTEVLRIENDGNVPQVIEFRSGIFSYWMRVDCMVGRGNDDADRVFIMAGFKRGSEIDLPFVNRFNLQGRGSYACLRDEGVEVRHTFPLAGIDKKSAEMVFSMHLTAFRRDVLEFNQMRNDELNPKQAE